MKKLLPLIRQSGVPVLFVVGGSDLKTHEKLFLKLLGHPGREDVKHLVIKGGHHAWPYMPEVLQQYRSVAGPFAEAAQWGAAGAAAPQAAA